MSDKPSLYVVEKKEVVILVILFVLVTVLSFTIGVRYGESVGRKAAQELELAEKETAGVEAESIGGKLGDAPKKSEAPKKEEANAEHGAASADKHGTAEKHEEAHGAAPAAASAGEEHEAKPPQKEAVEKNSDEFLLNALKESGVEPPGGKSPGDAKLPQEVKKIHSGAYVIQVGSHPTRSEAESQVRALKAKKVAVEILPPFKDRQGEWHRVVLGSYKTKRDAEKEAASLKSRGTILSYFVWRLP